MAKKFLETYASTTIGGIKDYYNNLENEMFWSFYAEELNHDIYEEVIHLRSCCDRELINFSVFDKHTTVFFVEDMPVSLAAVKKMMIYIQLSTALLGNLKNIITQIPPEFRIFQCGECMDYTPYLLMSINQLRGLFIAVMNGQIPHVALEKQFNNQSNYDTYEEGNIATTFYIKASIYVAFYNNSNVTVHGFKKTLPIPSMPNLLYSRSDKFIFDAPWSDSESRINADAEVSEVKEPKNAEEFFIKSMSRSGYNSSAGILHPGPANPYYDVEKNVNSSDRPDYP